MCGPPCGHWPAEQIGCLAQAARFSLHGIVEQHFINFWRSARPSTGDVVGAVTDYGLKYWYLPKLIDVVKIKPIWRYVFECERVKATEFCSTRNR